MQRKIENKIASDEVGSMVRRGMIVWWQEARGYGFVRPDDGGVDYFVAGTSLIEPFQPTPGQKVVFEIQRGHYGPQAHNVRTE